MVDGVSPFREEALLIVFQSKEKVTPVALAKKLSEVFSLQSAEARSVIRGLVQGEELSYTHRYGCTFLERSLVKPTYLTRKIIVTPPNRRCPEESQEFVICIDAGASFGAGDHPTTRLSVKCLERLLTEMDPDLHPNCSCLDIGTGSGILVIAAIKMGIGAGLGLDTDPIALFEARRNVALNGLARCIAVEGIPVENLSAEPYPLIMANLRTPTLLRLLPTIDRLLTDRGWIVVSGFRTDELPNLLTTYRLKGFRLACNEQEGEWGSAVLHRDVS